MSNGYTETSPTATYTHSPTLRMHTQEKSQCWCLQARCRQPKLLHTQQQ